MHDRNLELQAIREGAADALDVAHLDADSLERTIRCALARVRVAAARRAAVRSTNVQCASRFDISGNVARTLEILIQAAASAASTSEKI